MSVSSHQNKLSSCRTRVARRQLRSCTSFVLNLCNCCISGLYISNVYHHSNVTEQHKFCRHDLPLLDSWWICFSGRGFFVYKDVALLQWRDNFRTSRWCQIIIYQEQNTFLSLMQVIFSLIYEFFLPMSRLSFPKLWIKLTGFGHLPKKKARILQLIFPCIFC